MKQQPTLETDRLILRPFTLEDAPEVQRLAGDREVASTTKNILHPYEDGVAERWIGTLHAEYATNQSVVLAIVRRSDCALIGAIGLVINRVSTRAEIGYWIGKPYWSLGYCTEAAKAAIRYGFDVLELNRIHAHHLTRNPASGRVMQKAGMRHEGRLRQHVKKWGVFEDVEIYGILRAERMSNE